MFPHETQFQACVMESRCMHYNTMYYEKNIFH